MKKNLILKEKCYEVSDLLKSISHPQRLMIVCNLSEGEMSVGELQEACDISQSQLSQFLNRMAKEGLVKSRREGQFSFYSIKDERVFKLLNQMQKIFC